MLQAANGVGVGRKEKREERKKGGGLERERVRDACYKNPLLFIFVPAGVRKFLIG